MADLNRVIRDITALKKKIQKDLTTLVGKYTELRKDIDDKFNSELALQKGNYEGLEDFYALVMMARKDASSISGVLGLFKRLNDISDFDVSDIEDNMELREILSDK